ncbi:MAG: hypothetical protein AAF560_30030 [Acidobacteriota bacterium]
MIIFWEAVSSQTSYTWAAGADAFSGDVQRIQIREGRWRLFVKLKGEVEMAADEQSVALVGPDSFLEIEERNGHEQTRFKATPGPDGEPLIELFINREPAEFDDAARDWLEEMLPRVYRTTGLDAEARVGRILAAAGTPGVLDEIRRVEGDSVQRRYYEHLLVQTDPEALDYEILVRHMGQELGSDYELRQVLPRLPSIVLNEEPIANAFVSTADSIGSDYELRRTLSSFLERPDLTPEAYETVADAAQSIGGDYDQAELLIELLEIIPADQELPRGFARRLRDIGTDYELRKVLAVAMRRPQIATEELSDLLVASQTIGSDFDLAELLIELVGSYNGTLPDSYFRAVGTLGEDFHHRRVLSATVARPGLTVEEIEAALSSSLAIGSDHEMQQFLVDLAQVTPIDARLRPSFERAVASISSDYHREQVWAAAQG